MPYQLIIISIDNLVVDVDQAVTIYYKFMVRAAASVDWSILTE